MIFTVRGLWKCTYVKKLFVLWTLIITELNAKMLIVLPRIWKNSKKKKTVIETLKIMLEYHIINVFNF